MANYVVYIDETGSFSYMDKADTCFVGGWVCKSTDNLKAKLETLLKNAVETNNQAHGRKIQYPNDLHFFPMHVTTHPNEARAFFHNLFSSVKSLTYFHFRSSGRPLIIPHEQACYMEILRNTIIQLVNYKPLMDNCSSLSILIAHRRTEILYGYSGIEQPEKYERYLAEKLRGEIKQSLKGVFQAKISVDFASARRHPGLIIADFFCGALKTFNGYDYLTDYGPKINFRFNSGYQYFKFDSFENIRLAASLNPVAALMQAVQVYLGNESKSLRENLTILHGNLGKEEKAAFTKAILLYLDERLIADGKRYDSLNEGQILIDLLRSFMPLEVSKMNDEELATKASLDLHEIRIASHRGQISVKPVDDYIRFLHEKKDRLFNNRMLYLQQIIDASLIGVQVLAFNKLQFEKISEIIGPIRTLYEKVGNAIASTTNMPDENTARLEGTFGQMSAFLYNITGNQDYFEQAEKSLLKDVSACLSGSSTWKQGMGYLTALYWRNGLLDKAIDSFCREAGIPASQEQNLFNLEKWDLCGESREPFLMLHRIQVAALAAHQGKSITGHKVIRDHIGIPARLCSYPRSLTAKWLAVMYMQQGDYQSASTLLSAAMPKEKGKNFTLDFINLPIQMLYHFCLGKLGEKSNLNLQKEMDDLEKRQEGTRKILEQLGIARFDEPSDTWHPYELANLMPFYFA